MLRTLQGMAALILISCAGSASGREQPAAAQSNQTAQAFVYYEKVHAALSSDTLADVAGIAKALVAIVESVGGSQARQAADALVEAKTLESARTHFGDLSTLLVPKFQAEAIPGTTAYFCEMKKKAWVQKGKSVQNPYYGKAMLACGSPIPAKNKK